VARYLLFSFSLLSPLLEEREEVKREKGKNEQKISSPFSPFFRLSFLPNLSELPLLAGGLKH
jgi:hypothetical protein